MAILLANAVVLSSPLYAGHTADGAKTQTRAAVTAAPSDKHIIDVKHRISVESARCISVTP